MSAPTLSPTPISPTFRPGVCNSSWTRPSWPSLRRPDTRRALMRPPYSSRAGDVSAAEWQAVQQATNYRVVYTDLDTRGLGRTRGAADRPSRPPRGQRRRGDHAARWRRDRSQTVAAVDQLITQLQSRGYTFDTVSSIVGGSSSWHPATTSEQVQGTLVSAVVRASTCNHRRTEMGLPDSGWTGGRSNPAPGRYRPAPCTPAGDPRLRAATPRAGRLGSRSGLQRRGGHRSHRAFTGGQRLSPPRGRRRG